jgi:hypothetical protein
MTKYIKPGDFYIFYSIFNSQKSEINPHLQILLSFFPIKFEKPQKSPAIISVTLIYSIAAPWNCKQYYHSQGYPVVLVNPERSFVIRVSESLL